MAPFLTHNKVAVVTGASSGIGLALAREFALHDYNLIICSRSDEIYQAREELLDIGVEVMLVQANLATAIGVEKLFKAMQGCGQPIDSVAINAGVAVGGEFSETNLKEEIELINLNILSAVHLTKRFLPLMYRQGSGKILFTSSISALIPAPLLAVYSASKAFIASFAEAIRIEAEPHGVSVTALMPGPTNTNIFHRGHLDDTLLGGVMKYQNEPIDVARVGFEALMAGHEKVFAASRSTKFQGWISAYLPDRVKARLQKVVSEHHPSLDN